jgi:hypothetical protein
MKERGSSMLAVGRQRIEGLGLMRRFHMIFFPMIPGLLDARLLCLFTRVEGDRDWNVESLLELWAWV